MKGKLDGKVALISGVGEGIGGGIARRFAAEGATVACTGIQAEFFEAVTADIVSAGGHALSAVLNVESEDDWANAIAKTVEAFGRLDIVVNNAGVLSLASIEDTTLDEFRRVHAVNVDGTFLGIRQAIGAMRPGGLAGNGGSIINISSVAANTAMADHVAYGSSKAAVSAMTRHAASECASNGSGIRVNAICPGVVQTPMLVRTPENIQRCSDAHPLGLGEVDDVAAAALYLASDDARWVTGTELTVDGGLSVRP
jgi:NAD(P)-dependent dehydrogenase (short-subunit alcohol dehydrogenase family)